MVLFKEQSVLCIKGRYMAKNIFLLPLAHIIFELPFLWVFKSESNLFRDNL